MWFAMIVTKVGLAVLLVLVMLGSVASPAMAITETNNEILLKRVVVASIDEKGKLQLNVTWVNQTISFSNMSCACENNHVSCNALQRCH